jgi:hypothetical protein
VIVEASVVTGYVIAWAARKARRAAGRVDAETDALIDAGLDKLHAAVALKLGDHPALVDLEDESSSCGVISELTRQQIELALTAAARRDDAFGGEVTELLGQVRAAEAATGVSVIAGAGSTVFTGDAKASATNGGIALGQVGGDVHVFKPGGVGPDPS